MSFTTEQRYIEVEGAKHHNLKNISCKIPLHKLTVITGVSGSGKSSLAFDTVLQEAQRRFLYTLSNYTKQFLDLGVKPHVKAVRHLSPAISLSQNETLPTIRSSVATLSEMGELLGILFAQFGDRLCPKHGLVTSKIELDDLIEQVMSRFLGKTVAITLMIADKKKGLFQKEFAKFAKRGFLRAWVDGEMVDLDNPPSLNKEERHTIRVVIDALKAEKKNTARLKKSIELAISEGMDCQLIHAPSSTTLDLEDSQVINSHDGCPTCGYSWPALDPRYFSANSLAKCKACDGVGMFLDEYLDEALFFSEAKICDPCAGTGIQKDIGAIRINGKSIQDLHNATVDDLGKFLAGLSPTIKKHPSGARLIEELTDHIQALDKLHLSYLQLKRRIRSLSAGELQRLKLSGILRQSLTGVLYILDEPSQGLHQKEVESLCEILKDIRDQGNTLIVVDHDETLMMHADDILDLGPEGGMRGGSIVAQFVPSDAARYSKISTTARFLNEYQNNTLKKKVSGSKSFKDLTFFNLNKFNLKIDEIKFATHGLNLITGVSGAGKNSLAVYEVYARLFKGLNGFAEWEDLNVRSSEDIVHVTYIDRKPVAKSSMSMPATYLDVLNPIRDLYCQIPDAQILGLTKNDFSLARPGGRCETCGGRGEIKLEMRFLSDAKMECYDCLGAKYTLSVLSVQYKGYSIAQTLQMSIDEAKEHFAHHRIIQRKLEPAVSLGLGYLRMGQPSSSLSGGEAQRLKLAPYLAKKDVKGHVFIINEPSTGLHFEDIEKLVATLENLKAAGATVLIIDNHISLVERADRVFNLGPGSGQQGGQLLTLPS